MDQVKIEIRDSVNNLEGTLDVSDHEDFPLSITKTLATLNKLDQRSGSFSKTFKIPATKNNNTFLSYLYSTEQRPVKNIKDKKDALILVNDTIIERGYIKIKKVGVGKTAKDYELLFFGNNLDWVRQIAALKLEDIGMQNNAQTYNSAGIQNTWDKTFGEANSFAHCYPLINYGQWENNFLAQVEDFKPALRYIAIITNSLAEIGYKLNSTFLNTTDWKQLVMPIPQNFKLTDTIINNLKFRVGMTSDLIHDNSGFPVDTNFGTTGVINKIPFNDETSSGFFDNGNNYDASTNTYKLNQTNKQKFILKLNIDFPHPEFLDLVILLRIQKKPLTGSTSIITIKVIDDIKVGDNTINVDTGFIRFDDNDEITIDIITFFPSTIFFPNIVTFLTIKAVDTTWENEINDQILNTNTYNISDILPKDIFVLDLFNDLTKIFNLYWRTDNKTKEIFVEPRDDFYQPISQAIDWSNKLDISRQSEFEFISNYKRNFNFEYAQNSNDEPVKNRNIREKNRLGSYTHEFPDRFIEGSQTIKTTLINPTYYTIHNRVTLISDKEPVLAKIWIKDVADNSPPEFNRDIGIRILNFLGTKKQTLRNGNIAEFRFTTLQNIITTIPAALMHDLTDYALDVPINLSFNETDGLFNNHYKRSFKIIEDGIILTAFFYLKSTDIQNIKLNESIYIRQPEELQGYWIINSISDFSPLRAGLTKVELIKNKDFGVVSVDTTIITIEGKPKPFTGTGIVSTSGGVKKEFEPAIQAENFLTPSIILNNGTDNQASRNSASIAFGVGAIAPGREQAVYGNYNDPNSTDRFQVGAGENDNERVSAQRINQFGDFILYGGGVTIKDSEGAIVPVNVLTSENKILQVHLKK